MSGLFSIVYAVLYYPADRTVLDLSSASTGNTQIEYGVRSAVGMYETLCFQCVVLFTFIRFVPTFPV